MLTAGVASASVSPGPARTVSGAIPAAGGTLKKVIVLLRDKPAGLPARSAERARIVRAEERPLAQALRSQGARHVTSGTAIPFVIASVSSAQEKALKRDSAVRAVFPNVVIPAPTPEVPSGSQLFSPVTPSTSSSPLSGSLCPSNPAVPERDPEALSVVNAPEASGIDGRGVKVAYIAGPIDVNNPDFIRADGSHVFVDSQDFTGDPAGTPSGIPATESFLDASSIAAQGRDVYDLSNFVNPAHPLPPGCTITVTGTAPGASLVGLNVFSSAHDTTESNFIQAIDYAVSVDHVDVLNESFGANPFPDLALDATRIADDAAVAAGTTVVVSSGDSGVTSTTGSPATDPKLISVGASTTFRAYLQDTFGGSNLNNGTWLDNNISSLSSGGFAQDGGTVDLVAPGDLNWALCTPDPTLYPDCTNESGAPSGLQLGGGTSESSPLTAGAAADVIQAYRSTHGGSSPTPALVKQILMSTATDIGAPAEQQGAGLLNIGAAVKEAESVDGGSGTHDGSLLMSPNQINIAQNPGRETKRPLSITNTGGQPVTVDLSTRTLTHEVASQSGSFCLNPSSAPISCGPPTTSSFVIWSGFTEVFQEQTFTVPSTNTPSRLNFSANYPFTGQNSLLHVALYDPSGAYAGYSLPQGLANYANIQVTDPAPGKWTAVFFTVKDGPGNVGTSGTIQWQADTWTFGPAGSIKPATLTIAPGATSTAMFTAKSPHHPGDAAQSILIHGSDGSTTTVPVTVRTLVRTGHGRHAGVFQGVLTGGNGRGNPAQSNTYAFDVPKGQHDIDASVSLSDTSDGVVAFLQDPEGNTVANSSNITLDATGTNVIGTGAVNVYKDNPQPGRWTLVLDWTPPLFGSSFAELSEPFTGRIQFNQVRADANLPHGGMKLRQGQSYTFDVAVKNTAQTPETFFLDPRLPGSTTIQLTDLNGSDQNMKLPLPSGLSFPLYVVPTDTSSLQTSLTGSAPVQYDIGPFVGDPDLGSNQGTTASLNLSSGDEIEPGIWLLNPSEIGPYGPSGAGPVTASATFDAVTQPFDSTVDPSTGDLWTAVNGFTSNFSPVYLQPGQSAAIPLTITPTASPGTHVSGFVNLDDAFQLNPVGFSFAGGDELASLPFSYTVSG